MTAIKVRVRNRSPALSTTPQESQPARARVRFFIAKIFSPFSLNASGVNSVWRKFPLADLKPAQSALFTRRKFDVAMDAKPTLCLFPAKAEEDSTSDRTVSSSHTPMSDAGQLNNEKRIHLN
ncbi:hypothetical protein P0D71_20435 [Paraburkholderia sp. RL17-383-BIF-A]|uniref:hypothetical protein n=1 Tax=Paraburkholderia sp. RL17-383-BIF-A TaxID=3031631 RepID=UPI0038BD4F55